MSLNQYQPLLVWLQPERKMTRERPMTEMSLQVLLMLVFPRGPCQSHCPSAGPVDVVWHNWQSQCRKWQDPSEDGDWIHTSSHPIKGNFSRSTFRWIKGTAFGRGPSAHPSAGRPSSCRFCVQRELSPQSLMSASEPFQAGWWVWVHIVFVKRCPHDV